MTVPKEEESDDEPKTPEERMKEMREKARERQQQGRGLGMPTPSPLGRMPGMGGQTSDKALTKSIEGLRADIQEVKEYLRRILEELQKD